MSASGRRRALQSLGALAASPLLPACRPAPPEAPAAPFGAGALRLDLRHGGGRFELAGLRKEPHWPRGLDRLTAAPDWGDYRVALVGPGGDVLFSEGFDSTVGDGPSFARISARVPMPAQRVTAVISQRLPGNTFRDVSLFPLDPHDPSIDAAPIPVPRIESIMDKGDAAAKVDLAILGDGYPESDYAKFIADAKRAAGYLFSVEPFARHAADFNVRTVFVPSEESGVTDPYLGVRRKTSFGAAYGQGDAERTLSLPDERALREAAAAVPYDFLLVLANARRYGGSARFGGPAAVSIDSAAARYLVLHELAHVIGGLAEEYYIPDGGGPAYAGNVEPWHPNVTLSASAGKWRVGEGSAPRAWNKSEYERHFAGYVKRYYALRGRHASEAEVERLMSDAAARQAVLLSKAERDVGLYEGAHGYAKGVYRAEADCIMFSLQTRRFCKACEAALERAIDAITQ